MNSAGWVKDKGVLITGAGRGIGKRLAIGFAQHSARVALLARSKAELDLTNLEIEHAGGSSLRLRANVCDLEQLTAAVGRMRTHYGRIDILVCSAAIPGPIGPFLETPAHAWAEAIETNLLGVVNACRAVLPYMTEKRSGKIIVLVGRGAADPRPNFSAYAVSKAAVVRFVETLAEEVQDYNIQVNAMSPGGTYTHMTDEILRAGGKAGWKEQQRALELRLTGGEPPEKQLQLALFLASEAANHISGRLIHVSDDWRRLAHTTPSRDLYTLRRVQKG
ncbi:MAG TPA: SDR family oxidoreductase [Bryobacteraceae bacterium]|nr:SDR family oxidoreductase [Bryobacteraceae bacterium]